MIDRGFKRDPVATMASPYSDFDSMLGVIVDALREGPYLLGDRFSAADVL
jgi:glutathione S-transferase